MHIWPFRAPSHQLFTAAFNRAAADRISLLGGLTEYNSTHRRFKIPFDIGDIVKLLENGGLIEGMLADFDEIAA
jgi:hypothetical protein